MLEGIVSGDAIAHALEQVVDGLIQMISANRRLEMFPETFNRIEIG